MTPYQGCQIDDTMDEKVALLADDVEGSIGTIEVVEAPSEGAPLPGGVDYCRWNLRVPRSPEPPTSTVETRDSMARIARLMEERNWGEGRC